MAYKYIDPGEFFREWLIEEAEKKIAVAQGEGYTIDQAIELVKLQCLNAIYDTLRNM